MEESELHKTDFFQLGLMLEKALDGVAVPKFSTDVILHDYVERTKRQGFTKPFGAKANLFFSSRTLYIKLSDREYVLYPIPRRDRTGYSIRYAILREFKTERGLHYVFYMGKGGSGGEVVFSSHFVDRYKERVGLKTTRMETLANLFKMIASSHYIYSEPIFSGENIKDYPIEIYLEQGMGVGRRYPMGEDIYRDYIQTFINLDMMFRDQLERHAEAYMSGLN